MTTPPRRPIALFFFVLFATSPICSLTAQDNREDQNAEAQNSPVVTNVDGEISKQSVDDALAAIAADSDVDESLAADLKQRLQRTSQALDDAEKLQQQQAEFSQLQENAAESIAKAKSDLESLEPASSDSFDGFTEEQFASQIAETEADLADATKHSQELAAEPARRQTRLNQIPGQIDEANKELKNLREQLRQADASNESAIEAKTRKMWLVARERELSQLVELLNRERLAYSATIELLSLQQQYQDRKVKQLRERLDLLKTRRAEAKRSEVADTIDEAKQLADDVPESLRPLAEANIELADLQQTMIQDSAAVAENVSAIKDAKDVVVKELATSTQRVEAVGLTDALAAMLRERREDFAKLAEQFRPNREVGDRIKKLQIESFQMEDELQEVDEALQGFGAQTIDWKSEEFDLSTKTQDEVEWVLLKRRRDLLQEALGIQSSLI